MKPTPPELQKVQITPKQIPPLGNVAALLAPGKEPVARPRNHGAAWLNADVIGATCLLLLAVPARAIAEIIGRKPDAVVAKLHACRVLSYESANFHAYPGDYYPSSAFLKAHSMLRSWHRVVAADVFDAARHICKLNSVTARAAAEIKYEDLQPEVQDILRRVCYAHNTWVESEVIQIPQIAPEELQSNSRMLELGKANTCTISVFADKYFNLQQVPKGFKENIMNETIVAVKEADFTFELVPTINGKAIQNMSPDARIEALKRAERQITELNALKKKPKAVVKRIDAIQAAIDAAVAWMDANENV